MQRESLKLDGAAALDAQLAALSEQVATQIGRDAVIASAEILKAAWVEAAPYASGEQSVASKRYGHTRDNIKIGPVKAHNIHAVVYKVFTGNAFWAYWYEFGNARQQPRPWARPAVDRVKDRIIEAQIEALNAGIEAAT